MGSSGPSCGVVNDCSIIFRRRATSTSMQWHISISSRILICRFTGIWNGEAIRGTWDLSSNGGAFSLTPTFTDVRVLPSPLIDCFLMPSFLPSLLSAISQWQVQRILRPGRFSWRDGMRCPIPFLFPFRFSSLRISHRPWYYSSSSVRIMRSQGLDRIRLTSLPGRAHSILSLVSSTS